MSDASTVQMPKPLISPSVGPRTLEALILEMNEHDPVRAAKEYPWADRFVMGIPLAPWQREFKWTPEQCGRFISSAYSGVHLGTYLMTKFDVDSGPGGVGVEFPYLSNMLIDGQQRLTAIEMYLKDQIAVPDVNGRPTLWSEVGRLDQIRFKRTIFSRGEVGFDSELELRRVYDLMNFGGVAHLDSERALKSDGTANLDVGAIRKPRPR